MRAIKKNVLKQLLVLKKMSVILVLVLFLSVIFPYTSVAEENNQDSSNSGRTISGTITLPKDFVAAFNGSHADIGNLFIWINAIYTNSQNVYGSADFMWQTECCEKLNSKYSYSYMFRRNSKEMILRSVSKWDPTTMRAQAADIHRFFTVIIQAMLL